MVCPLTPPPYCKNKHGYLELKCGSEALVDFDACSVEVRVGRRGEGVSQAENFRREVVSVGNKGLQKRGCWVGKERASS